jgi:hypothetical protein
MVTGVWGAAQMKGRFGEFVPAYREGLKNFYHHLADHEDDFLDVNGGGVDRR